MHTVPTERDSSGTPVTWRGRLLVLGGFGIAAAATAVAVATGSGIHAAGPIWWFAAGWAVLAGFALALRRGLRHRDWSVFRGYEFPDNADLVDWSSRTGRYAWLREWEDRRRFNDDHLR